MLFAISVHPTSVTSSVFGHVSGSAEHQRPVMFGLCPGRDRIGSIVPFNHSCGVADVDRRTSVSLPCKASCRRTLKSTATELDASHDFSVRISPLPYRNMTWPAKGLCQPIGSRNAVIAV